jgi:hypothetical protein
MTREPRPASGRLPNEERNGEAMMVIDANVLWSGRVIPLLRMTDEGGSMAASRRRVVL